MIESQTHDGAEAMCVCVERERQEGYEWREKVTEDGRWRKKVGLSGATLLRLLSIFSAGTTDCWDRCGALCSDGPELLLMSDSTPEGEARPRLTPRKHHPSVRVHA